MTGVGGKMVGNIWLRKMHLKLLKPSAGAMVRVKTRKIRDQH
jgi:hypothetical protein